MPWFDKWYYTTLESKLLKLASRVISISKDAAKDIVTHYGYPLNRIDVIYLAPGDHFHPTHAEEIKRIRKKYHLSNLYFIHVGHLNRKKN